MISERAEDGVGILWNSCGGSESDSLMTWLRDGLASIAFIRPFILKEYLNKTLCKQDLFRDLKAAFISSRKITPLLGNRIDR